MQWSLFIKLVAMAPALFSIMASAKGSYGGQYTLTSGFDRYQNAITIPDGDFSLNIEESDSATDYEMQLKVFNTMGTTFNVTGPSGTSSTKEAIEVGEVWSTRMKPPEPLYQLELMMARMLPTMTTIEFILATGELTLEGEEGGLTFEISSLIPSD